MSQLLHQAWKDGRLLRPDSRTPNSVDLIHALAHVAGDRERVISENAHALSERIGECDQLVFVLIDGMGINLLDRLPAAAFLRTHLATELRSVYPSTTAAAITTLATGLWPAEHGVLGWWLYLAECALSITTLRFEERMTAESLEKRGLNADSIWPFKPLLAGLKHTPRSVHPAAFWDSAFNRFARGGTEGSGYTSIATAVDQVIGHVVTAARPSYTYLYLPELDTVCHRAGTESSHTLAMLVDLDAEMKRLAAALDSRARIVISADHGHQNVTKADHLAICDGDAILETLLAPPSGEPRGPYFHVRPGRAADFCAMFHDRFADRMALLTPDEADDLRLFGPAPLSPVARRRLGDYIGIAVDPVTLMYYPPGRPSDVNHNSHHAGMAPAEMRVPVILA